MSIAITLVCNKGGVGRSTSAQNVGWRLAKSNYKVLIVDLDSQANTSITLCKDYEALVITAKKSITEMLIMLCKKELLLMLKRMLPVGKSPATTRVKCNKSK